MRYVDPTGHVTCDNKNFDDGPNCKVKNPSRYDINIHPENFSSNDLYLRLHRQNPQLLWDGLTSAQQNVLSSGGWDKGGYNDTSRVVPADLLHDPLTYIELALGVRGLSKAGYTAIVIIGGQLATQNPDATYTIIGGFPEYKTFAQAYGYTYFDLGRWYDVLDAFGLAKPINSQYTLNQIYQAKTFFQISIGGAGTAQEVAQIQSSGLYTQIASGWSTFFGVFVPSQSAIH